MEDRISNKKREFLAKETAEMFLARYQLTADS
jgi:hypothetical protein